MWASPPQIYAKLAAIEYHILPCPTSRQGAARGQLLDQQPSAGVAAHLASVSSRVMGLPCSSHTAWGLEFNPLLVRPVQREDPFFPQACGRPFCFEIGASITIRSRPDPSFAKPAEIRSDTTSAPADGAVIQGLARHTPWAHPRDVPRDPRLRLRPPGLWQGRAMARRDAKGLSLLRLVDWRRRSRGTVLAGNVALPIGALFVGLLIFLDVVVHQPAN